MGTLDDFAQCAAPLALQRAVLWGEGGDYLNLKNERGWVVFVMSPVLLTHGRMYRSALCQSPNEVPETCLVKHGPTSMSLPHRHKANSSVGETARGFVFVAGLQVRSSVFNQSLQAGVAVSS